MIVFGNGVGVEVLSQYLLNALVSRSHTLERELRERYESVRAFEERDMLCYNIVIRNPRTLDVQ